MLIGIRMTEREWTIWQEATTRTIACADGMDKVRASVLDEAQKPR